MRENFNKVSEFTILVKRFIYSNFQDLKLYNEILNKNKSLDSWNLVLIDGI